jgi:hypothetical protein
MKSILAILIVVILSLTLSTILGLPRTASALPSDCKDHPWSKDCIPVEIRIFTIKHDCPNCGSIVLDKHFLDSIVKPGDGINTRGALAIFVHPEAHGYNVTSILAGNNSTEVRTFSLPLLMNQSSANSGLK